MKINYTIQAFEPLNDLFIVNFYTDFYTEEIVLNLALPVRDGAFLQGNDLDEYIRAFAPVSAFERKKMIAQLDASCITAMIPQSPPPTLEQMRVQLFTAVQNMLDMKVKERNYDNIQSACSYIASANPQFADEAMACVLWRDEVWAECYALLDKVAKGEMEIPTREKLLLMLPNMEWPS